MVSCFPLASERMSREAGKRRGKMVVFRFYGPRERRQWVRGEKGGSLYSSLPPPPLFPPLIAVPFMPLPILLYIISWKKREEKEKKKIIRQIGALFSTVLTP